MAFGIPNGKTVNFAKKGIWSLHKKSPPQEGHYIVALLLTSILGNFETILEKGPPKKNTTKIGVSDKSGEGKKMCFWSQNQRGEFGPRSWRIWSPKTGKFARAMLGRILPLKMLGSAAGSIFWKKRPKRDQILFLQRIYIYISACSL